MSRVDLVNVLGFLVALTLSAYGGTVSTGRGIPLPERAPELHVLAPETLPDGTRALRDAGGALVPLVRYERIVSGTMIADRVLSEICEPSRVLAYTEYSAQSSREAYRYAGKASLPGRASIETVLALHPDLYLVNNLVDPGYVARLREHGVRVFDLGHMRGLDTLLPQIRTIGWLIGAPERGAAYARDLERRMNAVASARRGKPAPRAMYLSIYVDRLYGGAGRTSYHEVLVHAGLRDAAAEAGLEGWPELTPERVLAIGPEVLVTKVGMGAVVCRHAGLEQLAPCQGRGRVIELDGVLLDDPGPTMLLATEALYDAMWGSGP